MNAYMHTWVRATHTCTHIPTYPPTRMHRCIRAGVKALFCRPHCTLAIVFQMFLILCVCVCVCVYVYRGRSPEGVREIFGPAQKKRLFQKLAEKETPGHPGKVVEIRPNNRIF